MKPIEVNLRVDLVVGPHVHCSLFVAGASCGKLIFGIEEYNLIELAMRRGIRHPDSNLLNKFDAEVYVEWIEQQGKK